MVEKVTTSSSGTGFNFFGFITAFYYLGFIAIFVLAEISNEISVSVWVRTYFNFLNFIKGRAAFLIFLGFMNCEIESNGELVLSVFVWIIAAVNFIVGFKEENSLPDKYWPKTSDQKAEKKPEIDLERPSSIHLKVDPNDISRQNVY